MIDADVRDRLAALGPFRAVLGVADLAQAMPGGGRQPVLPATPVAFVFEAAFAAAPTSRATGPVLQRLERDLAVVIGVRNVGDGGGAARSDVAELVTSVITALLGWQPAAAQRPLQLVSGQVVYALAGTVLFELMFGTSDQVEAQ